jgi:hypothetical protein
MVDVSSGFRVLGGRSNRALVATILRGVLDPAMSRLAGYQEIEARPSSNL